MDLLERAEEIAERRQNIPHDLCLVSYRALDDTVVVRSDSEWLKMIGDAFALISSMAREIERLRNPWRPIAEYQQGKKVIAGYRNELGNWRSITARYYPAGTLNSESDDADEDGFAPEGWYEESETHEYILPCTTPTHFQPLPPPPENHDHD